MMKIAYKSMVHLMVRLTILEYIRKDERIEACMDTMLAEEEFSRIYRDVLKKSAGEHLYKIYIVMCQYGFIWVTGGVNGGGEWERLGVNWRVEHLPPSLIPNNLIIVCNQWGRNKKNASNTLDKAEGKVRKVKQLGKD